MQKKLSVIMLMALTGCNTSTMTYTWYENIESNDFRIYSGFVGPEKDNAHYLNVYNTMKTWNGAYQGGKEKIEARKALLTRVADKEAQRVCPKGFTLKDDPNFVMTDKTENTYGGGLLGLAIAHMAANDENIPVSLHYSFACNLDKIEPQKSKD